MTPLENLDVQDETLDRAETDAVDVINNGPADVVDREATGNTALSTAKQELEKHTTDPTVAKATIDSYRAAKKEDYSQEKNDALVDAYLSLAQNPTVTLTREEIVAYEGFLGTVSFDAKDLKAVQLFFHREKVKQLTGEIQSDEFYTALCDAVVDRKYASESNDDAFRNHMKTWLKGPGKAALQSKVTAYFVTGLNNNDGGRREVGQFSENQVAALFNKRYENFPLLITPLGTEKIVSKEELRFKQDRLMTVSLERFRQKLGVAEEVWAVVNKEVQPYLTKEVSNLSEQETKQKYSLLVKPLSTYVCFGKEMTTIGTEIVAAQNRAYILGVFSIQGVDKETQHHIESMLDNTTSRKSINAFAQALFVAGDQQEQMVAEVVAHIADKGPENTYQFKNITLENLYSDTVIEQKPGTVQFSLESDETETYFESFPVETYLDDLKDQGNVENIVITLPQAQADLAANFQSYAEDQDMEISIVLSPTASEVRVDALEVVEENESISFTLNNLDYNQIGKHDLIADLLQKDMGEILRNPDYTIIGGKIGGSASHVRTDHVGKFTNSAVNQDLHNHLNLSTLPQNDPNNIDVTNNPSLAFDRAASFLDYLLSLDGKVAQDAKFDITTEMNGPTNETMDQQFGGRGDSTFARKRAEAAKAYQFATLSLNFKKKVRTPVSQTFQPTADPMPGKLLTLTTASKPSYTASSPKLPGRNPIPGLFDSVKGIFGKGKPNYSKCPVF